jgi:two-component system phosphate regulon sensor histidine kinase PhoR
MFKPRKLIWQIFPANVLTILVAIFIVSWYGAEALHEFYLSDTEKDLQSRANLIKPKVLELLHKGDIHGLREYCVNSGRNSGTRITVILEDGKVVADSNENPDIMDNHRQRVEIAKAFAGEVGSSRRFSKTLDENLIYVAIPLLQLHYLGDQLFAGDSIHGVLRTSVSVASLDKTLDAIQYRIGLGAFVVMFLAGLATLFISRNITKPLEEMTKSAEQFSRGDFSERMLPVAKKTSSAEVVTLAAAMDRMAELLDEKIQAIVTHRNQLETVFSSMVEAVIAIDIEERIIAINTAAAELFRIDRKKAAGKIMQELVRNVKLQQQISHTLSTREPIEDEIVLPGGSGDRNLQTNIVSLTNGVGEHVGALVVMNDVTNLRRLERVRSDFVANVSHELRTPITSIRGYVETLLDGALDIREDAEKFLEIVLRQSERLSSIIDDLLALSRIEEDSKQGTITLNPGQLLPVIENSVTTCHLKAEQAGVNVAFHCPEGLIVLMNAALLEQAIVNLLTNAIAYSKSGRDVEISIDAGQDEGMIGISVRDRGCGIAPEHLPRLFERFYRSDKARSRAVGGTGLGLAIVKHIAQAHNGRVEVSSTEGEGSTFTIHVHRA